VLGFTPLEVVKIRQQSAGPAPMPKRIPVTALLRGRSTAMLNNGLMQPARALSCLVVSQYRVSPTTLCSRLFESTPHFTIPRDKPMGIVGTLLSISRCQGRAGLYAGLTPTLLAAVPNTAIYLTAYDEITTSLRENHGTAPDGSAKGQICIPLLAAATARCISSLATAPLELIRTRQAGAIAAKTSCSQGVLDEIRHLSASGGPRALYRGLGPMVLRDVPFSALLFLGLETFKDSLSNSNCLGAWGVRHYQERDIKPPASVESMHTFLSAAAAGAIATIATTPFDVVKTRSQLVQQEDRKTKSGALRHMRRIVNEEGFGAGLWKGNVVRMVKVIPGCVITISCYEFGKRHFDDMFI